MGSKRIIVDSSFPEETRVAFVNGTAIEHFEVDISSSKKQLKGNGYSPVNDSENRRNDSIINHKKLNLV